MVVVGVGGGGGGVLPFLVCKIGVQQRNFTGPQESARKTKRRICCWGLLPVSRATDVLNYAFN